MSRPNVQLRCNQQENVKMYLFFFNLRLCLMDTEPSGVCIQSKDKCCEFRTLFVGYVNYGNSGLEEESFFSIMVRVY